MLIRHFLSPNPPPTSAEFQILLQEFDGQNLRSASVFQTGRVLDERLHGFFLVHIVLLLPYHEHGIVHFRDVAGVDACER